MSDYERNRGKLTPTSLTVDEIFTIVGGTEEDLSIYEDKEGYISDQCVDKYVFIGDKIYESEFSVRRETDSLEFAEVIENDDGIIYFHTYHYNGGAYWSEVVENELKKQRGK